MYNYNCILYRLYDTNITSYLFIINYGFWTFLYFHASLPLGFCKISFFIGWKIHHHDIYNEYNVYNIPICDFLFSATKS